MFVLVLRQDCAISLIGIFTPQEEETTAILVVRLTLSTLLHCLDIMGSPKCVCKLMHEGVPASGMIDKNDFFSTVYYGNCMLGYESL